MDENFKRYLELVDKIEENSDGTKVVRIKNLGEITPKLVDQLGLMKDVEGVTLGDSEVQGISDTYTVAQIKKILNGMEQLVGDLKDNKTLSDYEKVLLVSKRINQGVTYDNDLIRREENNDAWRHESIQARNLVSPMIEGKAVCAGYADMFHEAMKCLEIPVKSIAGPVWNNGEVNGHAWNQVQIDGEWYNLDLTRVDKESETSLRKWQKKDKELLARHYTDPIALLKNDEYFNSVGLEESSSWKTQEEFEEAMKSKTSIIRNVVYMPQAIIKGGGAEKCTAEIPLSQKLESIENIEAYEKSIGIDNRQIEIEQAEKPGLWQRVKNMFNKKEEHLALPEASGQEVVQEGASASVESAVSNVSKVSEISAKDKGNEFREGLKVSKEVLEQNAKANEEQAEIAKNDIEKDDSVKDNIGFEDER